MNARPLLASIALLLLAAAAAAKPPIPTPLNTPVVGEADALLLKKLYEHADPEAGLAQLQQDDEFRELVRKHDLRLFSGPMLGCVTENSARIWLRTAHAASVDVVVTDALSSLAVGQPVTAKTTAASDFTAVLKIEGLKPWTRYRYELRIDGARAPRQGYLPMFRTAPARGQRVAFSVGFGGGARYVPEKEFIWDTIAEHRPQAFLFLGDNVYIDQPKWRNKQRVLYYRRQMRGEFRRLSSITSCYAIWDDHDFGANDVSGGLETFKPDWKLPVWRVFKQNWNNPSYGGGAKQPGCWFDFRIGDVQFFMTDGRYYRSFKDGTMLGPAQKRWLLEALQKSDAKFKVIASGTLWTKHADKGGKDSWWGAKEEREEIFSLIDREKIGGVVLLSADRHRTDIYRIKRPNGYDLYEFETSKLTNNHTHATRDKALFSYNKGNFFGLLNFDLAQDDPVMTFYCIDNSGERIHEMAVPLSRLQAP